MIQSMRVFSLVDATLYLFTLFSFLPLVPSKKVTGEFQLIPFFPAGWYD